MHSAVWWHEYIRWFTVINSCESTVSNRLWKRRKNVFEHRRLSKEREKPANNEHQQQTPAVNKGQCQAQTTAGGVAHFPTRHVMQPRVFAAAFISAAAASGSYIYCAVKTTAVLHRLNDERSTKTTAQQQRTYQFRALHSHSQLTEDG